MLVDGALCQRTMGPARALAEQLLSEHFTVHAYDRRGRGESGPGESPYAVQREVEDLVAVIEAAGGHAHVVRRLVGGRAGARGRAGGHPRATGSRSTRRRSSSTTPTRRTTPSSPRGPQQLVDDGRRG